VLSAGALGSVIVDIDGAGEAVDWALGGKEGPLKRFEPPVEALGRLAKGLAASLVGDCWAGTASCAGAACGVGGVKAG
jgi:hypothetical protein